MNISKKKASAEELYLLGMKGVAIARLLDVSENTLSAWVAEGGWRLKRAEAATKKKSRLARLDNIIDFMLEAMEHEAESRRSANDWTTLDKGEIDALIKLYSAIKGKDLTLAAVIDLIREFLNYLAEKNADLAKRLVPYTEDFLLIKQDQLADA